MGDDHSTAVRRQPRWLAFSGAAVIAAAAIPVAAIVFLILRYAVPIPVLDDWEMVPIVTDAHEHHLDFSRLFEQQQEARTFFPKLLFLLFSAGRYWDGRVAMIFSVLLCCLTGLGIYRLLKQSGLSSRVSASVLLLIVPLIFSPAQNELWLLASGFPSFLPALCLVWAMNVLRSNWTIAAKFWVCLALTVFGSFSLANGLLLWGLTFPAAFAMGPVRRPLRWFGFWWLACAIFAGLYFWEFHAVSDLPRFAPAKPLSEYFGYVAAFLGSSLGSSGNANPLTFSITVGAVILLFFSIALGYTVFRCRNAEFCGRALPWIALATFSVGSALLAALGRIEWGVAQALESRYIAFSLYGIVGLLGLGAVFARNFVAEAKRRGLGIPVYAVFILVCGAYLALHLTCALSSVPKFRWRSAAARMGQGGVLFSQVLDSSKAIQAGNFPRPWVVQQRAAALDHLHMLRTPLFRSARISDLRHAEIDGNASGWLDGLVVNAGAATAWGWASLPSGDRPADCVVLAYENESSEWIAFALSNITMPRPDVAQALHNPEQLWAGWRAEFPVAGLPAGARLSAWGVDAKAGKLYRLKTAQAAPTL